jgi:hypothetical protein
MLTVTVTAELYPPNIAKLDTRPRFTTRYVPTADQCTALFADPLPFPAAR